MDSLAVVSNNPQQDFLSIAVSISILLSFFIALLMLYTTIINTRLAKHTFMASFRPYLGVTTYKHNIISDYPHIILSIKVQNFGSVPAKKVNSLLEIFIDDDKLPANNCESDNQTFFPNWVHTLDFKLKNEHLSTSIKKGEKILKARVYIEYYGITNKKHSTEEIAVYNKDAQIFVKDGVGKWL